MPLFRQPLAWRVMAAQPDGPPRLRLRPTIDIELEVSPGGWLAVHDFALFDTGSSFALFSATWARAVGIRLPRTPSRLPLRTASGRATYTVYDLDLHIRFSRLPESPFHLACVFSEEYSPTAPPLLGLHNLLNGWRVTVDGSFDPNAPMGHVRFDSLSS